MTPEETNEVQDVQVEIATEPELPGLSDMPEQDASGKQSKKEKKHWIKNKIAREIVSWTATILIAVLIAVFINAYVIRSSRVDGNSMNNTLVHGQTVYISRLPYWFGDPEYGDIVVFDSEERERNFFVEIKESFQYNIITYNLFDVSHPQKYWIKRVVGLPGDTIAFKEDGFYRNGVKLEEDYAYYCEPLDYSEQWLGKSWTVGQDEVFLLGDNRNHSSDSRILGPISQGAILGKVVKQ